MRGLSNLTASLPASIFLTAFLVWPVHAAPDKNSASPPSEIGSCITGAGESLSRCTAESSIARKPGGVELAFDQTTPPKKAKKKWKRVEPVAPAETGIIENNSRYLRSQRATGPSGKVPSLQAPTLNSTLSRRAPPAGLVGQSQDPATGTGSPTTTPPTTTTLPPLACPPNCVLTPPPGGGIQVSDIRLKEDIIPLMRLNNGLELYRFRYKGRDQTAYVGVMAQEVQQIEPSAVSRHPDGYLMVNYDRIGLKLMTWKEWLAPTASSSLP